MYFFIYNFKYCFFLLTFS